MKPQTIQLFLPDGSPTSIKEAEITNRLVKAILFPRVKFEEVSKREAVHYTGVYFLFGQHEDDLMDMVYIGEGEDCFKRLKEHNRKKDFWTHAVVVTTKTNEYTKTDVKYLEHHCLAQAIAVGRYTSENGKDSQRPSLSEAREHDLLDNFETIKILLSTLGYPLFEELPAKKESDLYYCESKGIKAEGQYTDEGFWVFKGSEVVAQTTNKVRPWIVDSRDRLIHAGIVVCDGNRCVFTSNYLFNSPSAAAGVVLARSANGWLEWKTKTGKTLDEEKRKNV